MAGEHHSEPAPEITPAQLRQIIENEVEHLIDILDQLDPDPDDEDDGTGEPGSDEEPELGSLECLNQSFWSQGGDGEPSLGWTGHEAAYGRYGAECQDCELDEADDEPSLGSLNNHHQQTSWGRSASKELEDEHDGSEPCCEDEGAQCDDEGAINADLEGRQHAEFSDYDWQALQAANASIPTPSVCEKPTNPVEEWRAAAAAQASATANAAVLVRDLRKAMGFSLCHTLRVLGGAIMK